MAGVVGKYGLFKKFKFAILIGFNP